MDFLDVLHGGFYMYINAKHYHHHLIGFSIQGNLIISGWGWGAAGRGNRHNSRESPFFHLIFSEHIIWPLRNLK